MKDKFRKWKRWLAFLLAFIVISTTVMGDVSFVKASPEAEETAVIEEETEAVEEEQEESAPAEEAGSAETPETPEAPKDGLASESAETVPDATETEQQEDESASETEQQMPEDPEAADAVDETDAEESDPAEEEGFTESVDEPESVPAEKTYETATVANDGIMVLAGGDIVSMQINEGETGQDNFQMSKTYSHRGHVVVELRSEEYKRLSADIGDKEIVSNVSFETSSNGKLYINITGNKPGTTDVTISGYYCYNYHGEVGNCTICGALVSTDSDLYDHPFSYTLRVTVNEVSKPVEKFKVTYTDGVDDETVFADQTYIVEEGDVTPEFNNDGNTAKVDEAGNPVRDGYKFEGWAPTVAETVTEDATYEATWSKVMEGVSPKEPRPSSKADGNVAGENIYGEQFVLRFDDIEPYNHNAVWHGIGGYGTNDGWITVSWDDGSEDATMTFHGEKYFNDKYTPWAAGKGYGDHEFRPGYSTDVTIKLQWNDEDQKWYPVEKEAVFYIQCIHTVTYEDDKGNEICSERITDDTVAKSADDPEFAGKLTPPDEKEFAGWDADGDGEADYQPEESIPTDKGDITLKPVWEYTQKITDLQKEWIKSADGLPEDIDVDGVAFANENGRVTIPKGGSVKLLFKITVSGNPGTDYTVTDEDAVHAGGDPMEGTIPEDGDAVIYVTKEYQESDKEVSISDPDVYYFTNTAKVEPGKEADNSTDSVQVLVDVDVPGLEDGDLTITKTASKEEVLVGEEFTYTLKVQNNTPDSVEDLIITDVLPDGIELSGELPKGVAESEGTLTWSVGTLGAEDAESVEIPVKATKYGKITNTVTAAVGGETVPTDDGTDGDVMSATVEVRIPGLEDGDLTLTKTASAGTVTVGSPFQYTLSVANNTGVDIPNVSVTDELPVGVELVSGQTLPSGVTYDEENRTITWNIDNLSANDTQSITFSVTATAAGTITNDMSAAVMADKAGEDDGTSGTSQTVPTTPTDPDNPGTTDPDADQPSVDVTVNPAPTTPGGGTGGGTGGGGGDTAPTPTPATAPPAALVAAAPAAPAPTAPAAPAPTAPAPAPAVENIADENVPLADGEDASVEPLTELEDEEVPLAGPLDTLHTCCILHLLILLLAMIVEIFYTSSMKKHQRKIFEIRRETAGR